MGETMADQRTAKTKRAIKSAMLRLMERMPGAQVSVAELAREAGVSRSSFYNHYTGVHELYYELVDDFDAGNLPIAGGLRCDECENGRKPFCMRLRDAGELAPLVADPGFLPALMARASKAERGLGSLAQEAGLAPEQASSLEVFQLAGCYVAAMSLPPEADWEPSRRAIDRFISRGAASFRTSAPMLPNCSKMESCAHRSRSIS